MLNQFQKQLKTTIMKTSNFIQLSDSPTLFVKFQYDSRAGFICKVENLLDVLKEQRNSGVEFIKKVNYLNGGKFDRVSKQELYNWAKAWLKTEEDLNFLNNHYYFKGCK